jgi:hypothetical protein
MAAMTTTLEEYSQDGNIRTYATTAHTLAKPQLMKQKRKHAVNPTASAEDTVSVIFGTEDADGALLSGRIVFEVSIRRPANALSTDITDSKALFREFVASDEFDEVVSGQKLLVG